MIHLVTLNPAIDEYINIDDFQLGKTNYRIQTTKVMGGKAVNVASVLQSLNQSATLVTTVDNSNPFIVDNLTKYNSYLIEVDHVRTNLKINDHGSITEINDRGSQLSIRAKMEFENYISKCVDADDIVLIAGNPHKNDEQFQFQLAQSAKAKGAKLFLDSNCFNFMMISELNPYFIKPNDDELTELLTGDKQVSDLTAICENLIVSHGGNGFTYYQQNNKVYQTPIEGKPVNTVGAGDSLVAGYIYGVANQLELNDKLLLAKYCASATVYSGNLATYSTIKSYDTTNII